MKLTLVLMVTMLLQASAAGYGQLVTLVRNNISLEKVFLEIHKQTGYDILVSTSQLKNERKLNVNFVNEPVEAVIKQLLKAEKNVTFSIAQNSIVIRSEDSSPMLRLNQQQQTVTGKVVDEKNLPLPNVTVKENNTQNYTLTNKDGEFSIKVSKIGVMLTFSFVGYANKTLAASSTPMMVSLVPDKRSLDEVVITGYQNLKKQSFTGAVSTVKVADVKLASLGTLDKMLQGQVAGMAIQTTSSVFGTAPKIRVRGSSSITGINEPLWVLDGVPLDAPLNIAPSELYSGAARNLLSSALANVSPDDIDDVTVLKDATATAMYGTRAVNGVIVITTKRAKNNTPLSINYSANGTLTMKPSIRNFDVLNSNEQTMLNQQMYEIYQSSLLNFTASNSGALSKLNDQLNRRIINDAEYQRQLADLKMRNTDWFDALYKNSVMQQHALSLSQGGEKVNGRLALSYYNDPGKTIGEKVERYTLSSTLGYQITKDFSTELLVKFSKRDQVNPGVKSNPFIYARDASRAMRPYDELGNLEYYKKGYANYNIIHELQNDYIDLNSTDFMVQANLKYKFTDRLNVNLLFNTRSIQSSIDEITTSTSNYANQFRAGSNVGEFMLRGRNPRLYRDPMALSSQLSNTVLPEGGILDREVTKANFYTARAQVEWAPLKADNDHQLNLFGGFEVTSNKQITDFNRGYGYMEESKTVTPNAMAIKRIVEGTGIQQDERRMYNGRDLLAGTYYYLNTFTRNAVAFYSSLSYNYKEKYIFDASARNDATNVFSGSKQKRFLPTWAVGGAWNVSKEDFMEGIDKYASAVKLRASYGLRGNAGNRGTNLISYKNNLTRSYSNYNTVGNVIYEPENVSLEYEKEYILSAGLDFTLFNKVDFTFNYYNRKNFDLLGYKATPPSSGYALKLFNWADMRNEGYELSVNMRPVTLAKDFSLNLLFNLGYNKNTIVSDYTGNDPTVFTVSASEGYPLKDKPLTGMYSFRFAGLSPEGLAQYYDKDGNVVLGFTSSNKDLANLAYQGSREPLFSGGFTSVFRYKNLSLSAAFVFNSGHVVRKADYYRGGNDFSLSRDDININGDFANRFRAKGNEAYTDIPVLLTEDVKDDYNRLGLFNQSIYTGYNNNDTRTIKASYLRFRNISLQWNLPSLAKRIGMQSFNLGFEGSNIAIFASKRLNGMDPETLLTGLNMPPVKTFTFSVSASF